MTETSLVLSGVEPSVNIPLLLERFWKRVDKNGPIHPYDEAKGACWIWKSSADTGGYGQFTYTERESYGGAITFRRVWMAHRLSCELRYGPLGNLLALHTCDNRKCVNPDHLYQGTHADNNRDCVKRGRNAVFFGDSHWSRKHPEKVQRGASHWTTRLKGRMRSGKKWHETYTPEMRSRGSKHYHSKLTEDQVIAMRAEYAAGGTSHKRLAKKYGVSHGNIAFILSRKSWAHV